MTGSTLNDSEGLLYRMNDVLIRKVAGTVAAIALGLALGIMGLQVFSRYVLNHSLIWGEELTRYLMIWSAMLGSATAYHMGQHTAMTYLEEKLPSWAGRLLLFLGQLAVLVFLVLAAWHGMGLTIRNVHRVQLSPALQWPIWYVYLSLPVGMGLMSLSALEALISGRAPNDADQAGVGD